LGTLLDICKFFLPWLGASAILINMLAGRQIREGKTRSCPRSKGAGHQEVH
jgi:hypothetical protein